MTTRERPRIGVFLVHYNLWSSPSILNAIEILAEHGYEVDVFTDSKQDGRDVNPRGLPIHVYDVGSTPRAPTSGPSSAPGSVPAGRLRALRRKVRLALPRRIQKPLLSVWEAFFLSYPNLLRGLARARRIAKRHEYVALIGAEALGLAMASMVAKRARTPVIYWCLELWIKSETHTLMHRSIKALEQRFHPGVSATILPTAEWGPILARENGVDLSAALVIPATARGPAFAATSNMIRARLEIPDDQLVALYAGSLAPWALARELAQAAHEWPAGVTLVLHGWGDPTYLDEVRKHVDNDRVRLSLDRLPYHEIDSLIASADVGLAFYRNDIMARAQIGTASGKIGQYLKCGVPVVASDQPGLAERFAPYPAGLTVHSPEEIGEAMRRIKPDLAKYREGARHCFKSEYDFDVHMVPLLKTLEDLRRGQGANP